MKKASKRSVRCTMCTTHRWRGNAKGRFKPRDEAARKRWRQQKLRLSEL